MQAGPARNRKKLCRQCHTLIKLTDGGRTCTHACAALNYELGADPVNKSVDIVDAWDRTIAGVAYMRGLSVHPDRGNDDMLTELEAAMILTETPLSPEEESSTEGSGQADSDQADDGPDSPPAHRRGSGLRYNLLDESTDDEVPPYNIDRGTPATEDSPPSPQPGPSNQRPDNFAALLEATRNAARDLRNQRRTPGNSTEEAPPTQPNNPAATPNPDSPSEDTPPSPLHTRSGRIREAPPAPEKRKPRAN